MDTVTETHKPLNKVAPMKRSTPGVAVSWSSNLSVGINEIDEQHKALISILNELHNAVRYNQGAGICLEIFDRLIDNTKTHFAVEENLLDMSDYPHYEDHHAEHTALLEEVQLIRNRVISGEIKISFKLLHFLRTWLTKHILGSDKAYANYLLEIGAED